MIDQELLELAAKAAGVEVTFDIDGTAWKKWPSFKWNPLTDDGDALRLAVKLRLGIKDFAPHDNSDLDELPTHGMIEIWRETDDDPIYVEWYKAGFDRYAATRRAIVRASAAIGEKL